MPVSVGTKLDQYTASFDTAVTGGETIVRREFVTAERGDIVTLKPLLGETGERLSFQFLPEGSGDNRPRSPNSRSRMPSRPVQAGPQQAGRSQFQALKTQSLLLLCVSHRPAIWSLVWQSWLRVGHAGTNSPQIGRPARENHGHLGRYRTANTISKRFLNQAVRVGM